VRRTHWGFVKLVCVRVRCREEFGFLLIELHGKEGVLCPKCHRLTVTAEAMRELMREIESAEKIGSSVCAAGMA
jgi:hypothetical protein